MGQVQEQLHVEQGIPPPTNKVHRLPNRHDLLRRERESGYRRAKWYANPIHCHHHRPLSFVYLLATDYIDQQNYVAAHNPGPETATVHNNDYIGIASFNIFVGIYVATIFGSAFFFDLFWPERQESPAVKLAWRVCSVLACLMTLACALAYTVIVATHSAYVTGTDAATASRLLAEYHGSPLQYRKNGRAVTSVVFLWIGMVATFARYVSSVYRPIYMLIVSAPRFCGVPWTTSMPTVRSQHMPAPAMASAPMSRRRLTAPRMAFPMATARPSCHAFLSSLQKTNSTLRKARIPASTQA